MIDELLHSGNNDERFITGYFDGNRFESGEFNFKLVMKKSELREPVCRFLQKDKEFLFLTGLTGKPWRLPHFTMCVSASKQGVVQFFYLIDIL